MRLKRRLGYLSLALFVTAAIGIFLSLPTSMQDINKQYITRNASPALRDPRFVIRKKARVLEVYNGRTLVKPYPVVIGFAPEGDKEREGDGKTPEGEFYVFTKNSKSRFHLSLGLSYPSIDDASRGFANGLITGAERNEIINAIEDKKMPPQKTALGGEIYIHGGGVERDWTWGCVAMKNEDVEEIYNLAKVGMKVIIYP